ncbi:DNA topoisomerase I [archaeon]|nr:DNA topoisomerase I [archaeon]
MASLILAEKPSAALKIAQAISNNPLKKTYARKVPYYELSFKSKKIIVVPAVGHLYALSEKAKNGWNYPVFDVEWKPIYEVNKSAKFSKPYLDAIKSLAKSAHEFIIATDYDIEGETIGYNILRFACNKKDAFRMRFSTTTKEDLLKSFISKSKTINYPQANAGITRHELDYYWGINLSRALTLSLKNSANIFKILSIGRVQGPALKIIVLREKSISSFKPAPYWEIELIAKEFNAWHKKGKFFKKSEAEQLIKKIEGKKAFVSKLDCSQYLQPQPNPFDLTALQIEAYKQFKIQPKDTLAIAQNLYTNSYISYPRTSSNQLPPSINYKKIISCLSAIPAYSHLCSILLSSKQLRPNNGKKTDPAHPAIHFTGEIPAKLSEHEQKIFDLIVHRTLASFAPPAKREAIKITLSILDEDFIMQGHSTIEPGWHVFYKDYLTLVDTELPKLKEGQEVKVMSISLHSKFTEPPKRYTVASIIKALEAKGLGTKATRAEIIENLFRRDYASLNTSISATSLGAKTFETLSLYCPDIMDEALTRHFEEEIEAISTKNKPRERILNEARQALIKILNKFRLNEKEIGKALAEAEIERRKQESVIGKCPSCSGNLKITFSPKTKSYFISCSNYPKCKTAFSLPRFYLAKPSGKSCEKCSFPAVFLIKKAKRPWLFCINPDCPSKEAWKRKREQSLQSSVTEQHNTPSSAKK